MDREKDSDAENKDMFDKLRAHQAEIEAKFGAQLDWYTQEDVRLCRIRFRQDGGYRDDESKWPEIQDRMTDAMVRLEGALRNFVQGIS
jgi:hypothetical protein